MNFLWFLMGSLIPMFVSFTYDIEMELSPEWIQTQGGGEFWQIFKNAFRLNVVSAFIYEVCAENRDTGLLDKNVLLNSSMSVGHPGTHQDATAIFKCQEVTIEQCKCSFESGTWHHNPSWRNCWKKFSTFLTSARSWSRSTQWNHFLELDAHRKALSAGKLMDWLKLAWTSWRSSPWFVQVSRHFHQFPPPGKSCKSYFCGAQYNGCTVLMQTVLLFAWALCHNLMGIGDQSSGH